MRVKHIIWEDTVNYRKPSLFIGMATCTFKCNPKLCQNADLAAAPDIIMRDAEIIHRYKENPLTEAIVLGGLEPLDQLNELALFCEMLNLHSVSDDLVIYTGYTEEEISKSILFLRDLNCPHRNLVVKYGRYLPGRPPVHDDVLGVTLASDNQHAVLYRRTDI